MEIDDARELDLSLMGAVQPISNSTKHINVRDVGVIKARRINKVEFLSIDSCWKSLNYRGF